MKDDRYLGKIFQNYRICQQIGQGGFGTTYLGEHQYLTGNLAAIKFLDSLIPPLLDEEATDENFKKILEE